LTLRENDKSNYNLEKLKVFRNFIFTYFLSVNSGTGSATNDWTSCIFNIRVHLKKSKTRRFNIIITWKSNIFFYKTTY